MKMNFYAVLFGGCKSSGLHCEFIRIVSIASIIGVSTRYVE